MDLEKIQKKTSKIEKKYQDVSSKDAWGTWWSLGWRVALEWASAVFISYLIGRGIDRLFNFKPWGVILCLLMGNIAGLLNIYRMHKKI